MSATSSPCAACKMQRRKCTQECVFAPYFPPDQPRKFASVHRVFGASNVARLLGDLSPEQREDAASSLAYEAEARLSDPVYGCLSYISFLQLRILQAQADLAAARKELFSFIGPAAYDPSLPHLDSTSAATAAAAAIMPQQAQVLHMQEQQLAEAREQEMLRSFHPAYQGGQMGISVGQMGCGGSGSGSGSGRTNVAIGRHPPAGLISPQEASNDGAYLVRQQAQQQMAQALLEQAQQQQHQRGISQL